MTRLVRYLALVAAAATVVAALFYFGVLRVNYPSRSRYPVRGIDVSHHQGEIDWSRIPVGEIAFAIIKATEGGDHRDTRFLENWQGARDAGLARGAYHFFTFCTPGEIQAANLIEALPLDDDMLPPAVDVEFVGNCRSWKDIPTIREYLGEFLSRIEPVYATRPILYVTDDSYRRIIEGHFDHYPLWVRSTFFAPRLPRGVDWVFWQHTGRGRVEGIDGFVDLNVFRGSRAEFGELSGTAAGGILSAPR